MTKRLENLAKKYADLYNADAIFVSTFKKAKKTSKLKNATNQEIDAENEQLHAEHILKVLPGLIEKTIKETIQKLEKK